MGNIGKVFDRGRWSFDRCDNCRTLFVVQGSVSQLLPAGVAAFQTAPPVPMSDNDPWPEYEAVSANAAHEYARMPAFAVHWSKTGQVLVGGGGGKAGTGIRSGIVGRVIALGRFPGV